jgi:divalent metal cation (Fe/Co/Zn/Cd) transporter
MKSLLEPLNRRNQIVAVISIGVAWRCSASSTSLTFMTGSVALFSDALESIVNVLTAVAALIAVRISSQPPDRGHPFGHHKAEYFAAVLEGALIIVAAHDDLSRGVPGILQPRA